MSSRLKRGPRKYSAISAEKTYASHVTVNGILIRLVKSTRKNSSKIGLMTLGHIDARNVKYLLRKMKDAVI